jgi:hypothetical protein
MTKYINTSCQAVIKQSSESHQAVNRQSSGSCQADVNNIPILFFEKRSVSLGVIGKALLGLVTVSECKVCQKDISRTKAISNLANFLKNYCPVMIYWLIETL